MKRLLLVPLLIILLSPLWVVPIHEGAHAVGCLSTGGDPTIEFQRDLGVLFAGRTFCEGNSFQDLATGLGPTLSLSLFGVIYLFWNFFQGRRGIIPFVIIALVGAQGIVLLGDSGKLITLGVPEWTLWIVVILSEATALISMYRYFSRDYVLSVKEGTN